MNHQNNQSQACPSPCISNCISLVFSLVCFRDLDSKQSWSQQNCCFWDVMLEAHASHPMDYEENIQMLSYFGHIAWRKGNNLEKIIMQGMIEGKRRKGRRRSRWIDQIRSAIGLPLRDFYALAEDRHQWCRVYEVTSCQAWQERTNQPVPLGFHGTP